MSPNNPRQARTCLLPVAEPPPRSVVASIAEHGLLAPKEQAFELPAAPSVAVIAREERRRMSAFRRRVAELRVSGSVAVIARHEPRWMSASREHVAELSTSTPVAVNARHERRGMWAFGRRVGELPAPTVVAFVAVHAAGFPRAGGSVSVDELRQARAFLLWVAELPPPAVAFRLVAFQEPACELSASARVAFVGGGKPVPISASRSGWRHESR